MFADLGEEQTEQKAPAVGISMYDNIPRKQQQTSSLKRPVQPDTESIPAKKPKPSRAAVPPGFIVTLAAAEDKGTRPVDLFSHDCVTMLACLVTSWTVAGTRHEMEDVAVMQLDARPDADYPWRQGSMPDAANMQLLHTSKD